VTNRFARAFRGCVAIVAACVAVVAARDAAAQSYDLIISEYIEGTSSNKLIEIYNGTGATINLATAQYKLLQYSNGATTPTTINLTGSILAGGTHVVANTAASAAFLALSQQTSGSLTFNGDDAIVLAKGASNSVIDGFGQVGLDPGTAWGTGTTATADRTLRRMASVVWGRTASTTAFDPATEWEGFAVDTSSGLGAHTANLAATQATQTASGGADAAADGWVLAVSGNAGSFQGNSGGNAGGAAAGAGNPAWGLYANGGGTVSATRMFTGGWIRPGQSASVQFDNGYIAVGSTVGVEFHQISASGASNVALAVRFTGATVSTP